MDASTTTPSSKSENAMDQEPEQLQRACFVTIGATAEFPDLLQAVLKPECIEKFLENGFTNLIIQYGGCNLLFDALKPEEDTGLTIEGFSWTESLTPCIKLCQAKPNQFAEGLVICHGGAGTILDVMRRAVPMIVVPNQDLLDNHQEELADELVKQGYVTKSSVSGLPAAVDIACKDMPSEWISHGSKFPAIVDKVVGYDVGYEEDVRVRLD